MKQPNRLTQWGVSCAALVSLSLLTACSPASSQEAEPSAARPDQLAVFGPHLVNSDGETVAIDSLAGKKVGLYFSALWCPPCRAFTPKLVETYNTWQEEGKAFELVFVSADRSADSMKKYMNDYEMPWLAFPFDAEQRETLPREHRVRGIPTLVILDEEGNVITRTGVNEIYAKGADAFDAW